MRLLLWRCHSFTGSRKRKLLLRVESKTRSTSILVPLLHACAFVPFEKLYNEADVCALLEIET